MTLAGCSSDGRFSEAWRKGQEARASIGLAAPVSTSYCIYMKPISVYVEELDYEELKALAASRRQPVAELIREAMTEYLVRSRAKSSMRDLPPLAAGRQREDWEREELYDEMLDERA